MPRHDFIFVAEKLSPTSSTLFYSPAEFLLSLYEAKALTPTPSLAAEIHGQKPEKIFFLYPQKKALSLLESLFHLYQGHLPPLVFVLDEAFYYHIHEWARIAGALTFQEMIFLLPHPQLKKSLEKFFHPQENLCHLLPWVLKKELPRARGTGPGHTWGAFHEGRDWEKLSNHMPLEISGPLELPRSFPLGQSYLPGLSYFKLQHFLQKNPKASYVGELDEKSYVEKLLGSSLSLGFLQCPFPHPPLDMIGYFLGLPCLGHDWGYGHFFDLEQKANQRQAPFLPVAVAQDISSILQRAGPKLAHFTDLFLRLSESGLKTPTRLWQEASEYWAYPPSFFELYPC